MSKTIPEWTCVSKAREFEIHFAAEEGTVSTELAARIEGAGFRDDKLVKRGVRLPPASAPSLAACPLIGLHVTWNSFDRGAYMDKLAEFRTIIANPEAAGCVGYAHAEVTRGEEDLAFERREFDPGARFPVAPMRSTPKPISKTWDIHISARIATLDARLEAVLRRGGLYSIDVDKGRRGIYRVFTTQGIGAVSMGRALFSSIASYLTRAGGFEGAAKFEQTVFFEIYGKAVIVPPTIEQVRYFA